MSDPHWLDSIEDAQRERHLSDREVARLLRIAFVARTVVGRVRRDVDASVALGMLAHLVDGWEPEDGESEPSERDDDESGAPWEKDELAEPEQSAPVAKSKRDSARRKDRPRAEPRCGGRGT